MVFDAYIAEPPGKLIDVFYTIGQIGLDSHVQQKELLKTDIFYRGEIVFQNPGDFELNIDARCSDIMSQNSLKFEKRIVVSVR